MNDPIYRENSRLREIGVNQVPMDSLEVNSERIERNNHNEPLSYDL